jgi:TonB family protein
VLAFLPASRPSNSHAFGTAIVASFVTVSLFTLTTGSVRRPGPDGKIAERLLRPKYLLPLLPGKAPRAKYESVQWLAASSLVPAPGFAVPAALKSLEKPKGYAASGDPPQLVPASVSETLDLGATGRVYVESELDRPVVRDPSSAAPEYPASLEKLGIEGSVAVEFVVDSLGHADSASMRVLSVSHVAFADAVRVALPHMLFSPAELGGRHVAQRVVQSYKFVMPQVANGQANQASSGPSARR